MTEKEIIEANMQICEFMGQRGNWLMGSPRDMQYHNSWTWLMPVVEKISTVQYTDKGWIGCDAYQDYAWPRTFGMRDEQGRYMVRFNASSLHTADTLIEAAWLAVVDFVQWYASSYGPKGPREAEPNKKLRDADQ